MNKAEQEQSLGQVVFGGAPIGVRQILDIAEGRAGVALSSDPQVREALGAGARLLAERLAAGDRIYGVTTGFGESCLTTVPDAEVPSLLLNLLWIVLGGGLAIAFNERDARVPWVAELSRLIRWDERERWRVPYTVEVDWSEVVADNGWTGWVDGRLLEAIAR